MALCLSPTQPTLHRRACDGDLIGIERLEEDGSFMKMEKTAKLSVLVSGDPSQLDNTCESCFK